MTRREVLEGARRVESGNEGRAGVGERVVGGGDLSGAVTSRQGPRQAWQCPSAAFWWQAEQSSWEPP